jgi:chloramphenicol O-acetyltransferase type A
MKYLDIKTWPRKEHYEFFKDFDEPFFGIVADIDCSKAYKFCKENSISFFSYYFHKSLIAVNSIEEFRYRIIDDKVAIFDKIHAAVTIGRDDGTFAFTFIEYNSDFEIFNKILQEGIQRVKESSGLFMYEDKTRKDVIHFSSTPWIKFKGLTHARSFATGDSTPLIVFGKSSNEYNKMTMPVAVNAHHSLMDAVHVAKFYSKFQELMNF